MPGVKAREDGGGGLQRGRGDKNTIPFDLLTFLEFTPTEAEDFFVSAICPLYTFSSILSASFIVQAASSEFRRLCQVQRKSILPDVSFLLSRALARKGLLDVCTTGIFIIPQIYVFPISEDVCI